MGKALDATCEALGLSEIAQKIIELAQRGLRNPVALSSAAVKELKSDSRS
jgi:hypothetical protein